MRILLTRPTKDARIVAERLREAGHEILSAPLLSVHFHDGPPLALDGVQGVLATSANGVRALARRTHRRDLPVFAVGPQTAKAARTAKFARVECAGGDAVALADAVPRWAQVQKGVLLHAAGAQGEARLASLLGAKGFEVRTEVLYDVVAADTLPAAVIEALSAGSLDAALFFSPRSARTFRDCVRNTDLSAACAGLAAICISKATAAALPPLKFRHVVIAAEPNQDALIDCIAIIGQS